MRDDSETAAPAARVLVAEAHPAHRVVACSLLRRAGLDAQGTTEAIEALRTLRLESFDALLLDVTLPDVQPDDARVASCHGGLLVLALLPAGADASEDADWRDAGFDGVLTRPFGPGLPGAVSALLRDGLPALNAGEALRRASDREDLAAEVAGLVAESLTLRLAEIEEALLLAGATNGADAVRLAHGLKGALGNVGARPARTAALRLEHAAREGDWDGAWRELARLRSHAGELMRALSPTIVGASR